MRPVLALIARPMAKKLACSGTQGVVVETLAKSENLMASMTSPILKRFFEMCCRHRFSCRILECTAKPTSPTRYA